ncbi:hypothetical protein L227DRAFT_93231 [Lentinus tigrinus ALCF2SS1-6]|uniref:Uncharacterized protein n=1 Tax=Lentinus tigrinus ALCF2SS1-6 TaxID=1328759 RepID=A0A5C2SBZ4_9APHY|nr:hypothetical protein L227DRAFT_93231 [Lentinus tigrinus ALCF2SS1-6]
MVLSDKALFALRFHACGACFGSDRNIPVPRRARGAVVACTADGRCGVLQWTVRTPPALILASPPSRYAPCLFCPSPDAHIDHKTRPEAKEGRRENLSVYVRLDRRVECRLCRRSNRKSAAMSGFGRLYASCGTIAMLPRRATSTAFHPNVRTSMSRTRPITPCRSMSVAECTGHRYYPYPVPVVARIFRGENTAESQIY